MRRKSSTPSSTEIVCRPIAMADVRRLPAIPSGYVTDRVFRLQRSEIGDSIQWRMYEVQLERPFRKLYDAGHVDDWLSSYLDSVAPERLHFIAAWRGDEVVGILTYQYLEWNGSVWLIDIRTPINARRQGVGSMLLGQLQEMARQERFRGIHVETQTTNYPAFSFYRKNGFVVSGFDDHLYTNEDLADGDVAVYLFWEALGKGTPR